MSATVMPRGGWFMRPGQILAIAAMLGVAFQIGHFAEHAVQFGVWLFSDRSAPWMSGPARWLTRMFGELAYPMPEICTDPAAWMARQMVLGMEILHIIGNSIFLATLAILCWFFPARLVRWAFCVEAFHLYEHIMLTSTAIFLGKPVGFSTLFGGNTYFFSQAGVVGYRVGWHFVMNLIPSALMMAWMMRDWPLVTRRMSQELSGG